MPLFIELSSRVDVFAETKIQMAKRKGRREKEEWIPALNVVAPRSIRSNRGLSVARGEGGASIHELPLEGVLQYDECCLNTTISLQSGLISRRKALLRLLAKRLFGPLWALQNSFLDLSVGGASVAPPYSATAWI